MSNTLMNHSRSLSRQQLTHINGGNRRENSYCHLDVCTRTRCAAEGGVPCKCVYGYPNDPGLCVRIR
ncbi:hypothetical protein [Chitinophaga nivalis]|uniref:EGF-like domain-containing protein n=1 Tax=Chitinophaga nivalis TaxID=2991709 RepID=A0ABT3IMP4_9BACT|nr:hypothetical protein [Chitinophaga nivalis]MCW3465080.1 hypothetical protein [Chitinophaga nivalis]MCW3485228.1 hypothetical protein [Chitinophaga nivalis]